MSRLRPSLPRRPDLVSLALVPLLAILAAAALSLTTGRIVPDATAANVTINANVSSGTVNIDVTNCTSATVAMPTVAAVNSTYPGAGPGLCDLTFGGSNNDRVEVTLDDGGSDATAFWERTGGGTIADKVGCSALAAGTNAGSVAVTAVGAGVTNQSGCATASYQGIPDNDASYCRGAGTTSTTAYTCELNFAITTGATLPAGGAYTGAAVFTAANY